MIDQPKVKVKRKRKKKYEVDILEVIAMSLDKTAKQISKELKIPSSIITKVIGGHYMLSDPESKKEKMKALGLKLCSCCGVRFVPLQPIKTNGYYTTLTRLCPICFRYESCGSLECHSMQIGNRKEMRYTELSW